MTKHNAIVLAFLCVAGTAASSQEVFLNAGFQQIVMLNPSLAGIEGNGILRLIYHNHYPGRGFNLHTVSVSYDTYLPLLHGGVAGFVSNNYNGGIINDIKGGFSYSYHFQAGRNTFAYAGLSSGLRHRGIYSGGIILPDQIDPLLGAVLPPSEVIAERGRTIFDVGTGFSVISGKYFAGLSVNHLAKPDAEGSGIPSDVLKRRVTIFASAVFTSGLRNRINFRPVILFDMAGNDYFNAAGAVVSTEAIAVNAMLVMNRSRNISMQGGLALKQRGNLFFYNYCFNLTSQYGILPVSLYHQGGISVSLNNVEKRKTIKTINFPEM